MKWSEVLRRFPAKIISLPDGELTYLEVAEKIAGVKSSLPHVLDGKWKRETLIDLFAALESGRPVTARAGDSEPEKISLLSSGTEGPARLISHPQENLFQFKSLYLNKKAGAVLRAGHAAGLEFLFSGVMGGNDLYLREDVKALGTLQLDVLHGPPTALGYMLSFPERFAPLLKKLQVFYCGTDSLPSAVAEKARTSGFPFSIRQVYGSTETWSIETETHPEKPWLLRITDQRGNLPSGDHFIEEESGWGRIESQRHWVANVNGTKINLVDLENSVLAIDGMVDVTASAERGPFSASVKLVLFTDRTDENKLNEILDQVLGTIPYTFELRKSSEVMMKKKNRQR